MKHPKFKINDVIEANLTMPSIQKILKEEFKIFNFKYSTITSDRFIRNYKFWPNEKKEQFYKILGGKVYSRKVKNLLESVQINEVN